MASPFTDLERTFFGLGGFGRRVAHLFEDTDVYAPTPFGNFTRLNIWDAGPNVVVWAEVPGMAEKDIQVTMNRDVLTISGERTHDVPEGYVAHRRERAAARFSRSVRLGIKVDVDKATAIVKNGVLSVTLPKAPEVQPRQIKITTSA
ncbi:MAG: Hsp20/alpha crystallin family protein [Myxococcota bacterium]